ncbi:MAG: O-antigen ligase family protein [Patescibacteria group bacterium]
MDLLKVLIPLFFLAFSLGEIARIQFPNSVTIGLFDISVVLLSFFILAKTRKNNFILKTPILLFILASIFSLIINVARYEPSQILIGSLYLVRWIAYTGIYFSAASLTDKGISYTLKFMMLSGIFIVLFGYIQLLFYPSLRNLYYLGWDEHMHRMFSTFLDPNFAGVFFVLFFVFLYLFRDKLVSNKILSSLFLLLTLGAVILTYSRGAYLMLLVCALIYSIVNRNWKIITGTILLFIAIFLVLSPGFYIENTNLLRMASTTQRLESSKQALAIFKKNPLGVGFNTFRYAREKYGFKDLSLYGPSHAGAGVDNSLILILTTTGILGFLIYLYLLYKMFRIGFLNFRKNKMGTVLIVSLGGLLVNSLFINSLLYSFAMAWIFLIAGLTENT